MGINAYNIKRWCKMLSGKSIYHVDQGLGKVIDIGGYYNDLTQKVVMGDSNLDRNGIPFLEHSDGSHVQMPTMIFQYGLGAYDLWLIQKEEVYRNKVKICADWACENQEDNGSWKNFFYIYPEHPYCAMAQGEGASLLIRAYKLYGEERYLEGAKRAIEFLLLDYQKGGVAKYSGSEVILLEYTHLPVVMNGWIFALWGLYDYCQVDSREEYVEAYDKTVKSLAASLSKFTFSYWSKYDIKGMIASPFYHHLHIAQMKAMYIITHKNVFNQYANVWEKQEKNILCKKLAFAVKVFQKIFEKE